MRERFAPSASAAAREKRRAGVIELLHRGAASTIAYRRRLIDSPSYTLNHEEVRKGARGRHPVRRRSDAARRRGRRVRSRGGADVRVHSAATRATGRDRRTSSCPRARSGRGGHPAQHRARARRQPRTFQLDGKYFQRRRRGRRDPCSRRTRSRSRHDAAVLLHRVRAMAVHQLLRRPASVVLRQRGEGDGQREAGLSDRQSRCSQKRRPRATRAPTIAFFVGSSTMPCARRVHEVVRLTPTIVEVVVRAPLAARAFQPGPVLSLAELRDALARRRRHAPRDGRSRADRRLGGPGARACFDDRARDGRLVRSVACAQARRAGRADGPDRHADRNSARRDRDAGGRRPRQRGAVLDRSGVARRAGIKVLYFAGYKTHDRSIQGRGDRSCGRCVVWCCDEAPGFTPTRPQDRAFVGNIVQAMRAYASGALGDAADRVRATAIASSRSAPTG